MYRRHPGSLFLWVPFFFFFTDCPKPMCWVSKFSVTQSRQSSVAHSFMQDLSFFSLSCMGPRGRLQFLCWHENSSPQPTTLCLLIITLSFVSLRLLLLCFELFISDIWGFPFLGFEFGYVFLKKSLCSVFMCLECVCACARFRSAWPEVPMDIYLFIQYFLSILWLAK